MSFTLDEMTNQLQSQLGIGYEKARTIALANQIANAVALPRAATATATTPTQGHSGIASATGGVSGAVPAQQSPSKNLTVTQNRTEKAEQLAIKNSALARGAFVYEFSQARATNQTPGIPDLYLVWPTHALWVEVKTEAGVLSQPQARFMAQCVANGTPHLVGTHADFLNWCHARGLRA